MILWEINPEERTVRSVDLEFLPQSYDNDASVYLNDHGDVIYRQRSSFSKFGFVIDGVRAPIIGTAYISGTDVNGDDVPPRVAYDSLIDHIDFGTCANDMFMGDTIVRGLQR